MNYHQLPIGYDYGHYWVIHVPAQMTENFFTKISDTTTFYPLEQDWYESQQRNDNMS